MLEPPYGAIENCRELMRRLAVFYDFECQGGKLAGCAEFQDVQRCVDAMAEWIIAVSEMSPNPAHSHSEQPADPRAPTPPPWPAPQPHRPVR